MKNAIYFLWLYPQEIRETVDISLLCVLAHIKVNLRGINSKRKIYIFFCVNTIAL